MTQTQRWMSWHTDKEQIIKSRTDNLQTHANKMRGMHRPREGHGPAYSIFQRPNAPKPAPEPAPEPVRSEPRPQLENEGAQAWRAKRPKPAPKAAPPHPSQNENPRPATTSHPTCARLCTPSTVMERKCKGSTSVS